MKRLTKKVFSLLTAILLVFGMPLNTSAAFFNGPNTAVFQVGVDVPFESHTYEYNHMATSDSVDVTATLPHGIQITDVYNTREIYRIHGTALPGTVGGAYSATATANGGTPNVINTTITVNKGPQTIVCNDQAASIGAASVFIAPVSIDGNGATINVSAVDPALTAGHQPTYTFGGGDPAIATIHPTTGEVTAVGQGQTAFTIDSATTGSYLAAAQKTINFTVNAAPTIQSQPADVAVSLGQTASFSVAATGGTAPYSYQWQNNSSGLFADIGGATSAAYTTPATTLDMNNLQYQCVVTDNSGVAIASNSALLTVLNTAKDITGFSIGGVNGTINGTDITVNVPYSTDVTSLAPNITHTGASVSPASGAAQDFSSPVTYTVSAADNSMKDYTATVNVAAKIDHSPENPPDPNTPLDLTTDAEFKFNGDYTKLARVLLNGQEMPQTPVAGESRAMLGWSSYSGNAGEVESGSVYVTLYKEFLKTLSGGKYTLAVEFNEDDGSIGTGALEFTLPQQTTYAPPPQTTPTSSHTYSGGSSNSATIKTWTPRVQQPIEYIIDKAEMQKLMATADKNSWDFVRSSSNLPTTVKSEAWALPTGKFVARTTVDKSVQVQLTFPQPGKITTDMKVSGWAKGSIVDSRKAFFEKWYTNKLRFIHLDHTGSFGQPVEIAAKVDLSGMDKDNLYIYRYDKATNSYTLVSRPHQTPREYWIDTNGYLHFVTAQGGGVVVSDGALAKR